MPLYSRKDMPQVNTQDLSKALSIAKSKVKVTKGMTIVGSLKPSQKELISNKVKAVSKKYNKPTDMKPLIISKDNYIVDDITDGPRQFTNSVKIQSFLHSDYT